MERTLNQPEITHRLIELIGDNFSYEEIIVIGRRFFPDFEIKTEENQFGRLRLPPHNASTHLIEVFRVSGKVPDLIRFLIDLDCHSLNGREVMFRGIEELLVTIRRCGIGYDFKAREFFFVSERDAGPEWEECLQEGKEYDFAYVSVDIVKSSQMARIEERALVERVLSALFDLVRRSASHYGGSVWSWQGDGGMITFFGPLRAEQSVFFSIEALGLLLVFNIGENPFANRVSLRFGIDMGKALYKKDKGNIISQNINFAAHLEKKCSDINTITVSDCVLDALQERQQSFFIKGGKLEGRQYFTFDPCGFFQRPAGFQEPAGGENHDGREKDNTKIKRKRFFNGRVQ
jgi:class 3 adenylate cyclase